MDLGRLGFFWALALAGFHQDLMIMVNTHQGVTVHMAAF